MSTDPSPAARFDPSLAFCAAASLSLNCGSARQQKSGRTRPRYRQALHLVRSLAKKRNQHWKPWQIVLPAVTGVLAAGAALFAAGAAFIKLIE